MENKSVEELSAETMTVEVAYALPERQEIIELTVSAGCTALEAVRLSNICQHFAEINIDEAVLGVFSKRLDGKALAAPADFVLKPMDRVEIYRPLELDPKAARLLRAEKARKKEQLAKEQSSKS